MNILALMGDLYDLKNDPEEFYNLIAEPGCANTAKSLMTRLEEWERRTSINGNTSR